MLVPSFCRIGRTTPSFCCTSAHSRCSGASWGLCLSCAWVWASCNASWLLRVNLSKRIIGTPWVLTDGSAADYQDEDSRSPRRTCFLLRVSNLDLLRLDLFLLRQRDL